ncbi:MAG TPA: GAF domain-containing protein [Arthrobacter sp.]|nr:GAF domain-containing protein [Arthrobacter sp.]
MAGIFEVFTDFHFQIRFRLLAADGTVLATSQAYPDKRTAAAAIAEVRECAGTGLINDQSAATPKAVGLPGPYRRKISHGRSTQRTIRTAPAAPQSSMDVRLLDLILDSNDFGQFLGGLATLAATTLSRAGTEMSCGITVRQTKKPVALAGSEPGARSMDELHNILGEGPGLTAMAEQRTVLAADLDEVHPWPRFAGSAARHGIRSVLCVPLSAEGETRAALTLYARRPHAFSPEDIDTAEAFAAQASRGLTLALYIAHLKDTTQNLSAALAHRATIDTALGVVMGQSRCNHDAAFTILERASSTRNVKLRDLAASIVTSVSGDKPSPFHFDP